MPKALENRPVLEVELAKVLECYNMVRTDMGIQLSEVVLYCSMVGIYDVEKFCYLVKVIDNTVRNHNKDKV